MEVHIVTKRVLVVLLFFNVIDYWANDCHRLDLGAGRVVDDSPSSSSIRVVSEDVALLSLPLDAVAH